MKTKKIYGVEYNYCPILKKVEYRPNEWIPEKKIRNERRYAKESISEQKIEVRLPQNLIDDLGSIKLHRYERELMYYFFHCLLNKIWYIRKNEVKFPTKVIRKIINQRLELEFISLKNSFLTKNPILTNEIIRGRIRKEINLFSISEPYLKEKRVKIELTIEKSVQHILNYQKGYNTSDPFQLTILKRHFSHFSFPLEKLKKNHSLDSEFLIEMENKSLIFQDSFASRYYSPISNLKKSDRLELEVGYDGYMESTVELDFRNSQPFMFFTILKNLKQVNLWLKEDIKLNFEWTEKLTLLKNSAFDGKFYEVFWSLIKYETELYIDSLGSLNEFENLTDREMSKKMFMKCFFGRSDSKASKVLMKSIPELHELLKTLKDIQLNHFKGVSYKNTSYLLQAIEKSFLDKIIVECDRSGIYILTIHDSLICANSKKDKLEKIINGVFNSAIGICPVLITCSKENKYLTHDNISSIIDRIMSNSETEIIDEVLELNEFGDDDFDEFYSIIDGLIED